MQERRRRFVPGRTRWWLCLILMAASLPSAAQVREPGADGRRQLEQARELMKESAADRMPALALLDEAVEAARAAAAPSIEAEAKLSRGELRLNLGRDEPAALADLEAAKALWVAEPDWTRAARASTLAGVVLRRLGRLDEAEAAHRQALAWYEQEADRAGLGTVHHNLGALFYSRSRLDEAIIEYEASIAIRTTLGDVASTAGTLNNLATVYGNRGDLDRAMTAHRQAREVALASGSANDVAYATLGLGSQSFALGAWQESMTFLADASKRFEALGDRSGLAFANHTLGVVYLGLGHDVDAITLLESVLPLRAHDPARLGTTLQSLAGAYRAAGQIDDARSALESALALKRKALDRFGEAATLRSLCALELAEGRYAEALGHATLARSLAEQAKTPDGVALATALMSSATGSRPEPVLAADLERQAADPVVRRVPRTEAVLHAELARVALNQGDLDRARSHVAAALARVEQVRAGVAALDLRATYLASHADLMDLQVDILLRSHEASPAAGHDRDAFLAAERARSRRVRDALADAALPRSAANPARAREVQLENGVSAAALQLDRAISRAAADVSELQAEFDRRSLALRNFRAEMRAQLPWRREDPSPDFDAIQQRVPEGTVLLAYWLSPHRSAAWVLTSRSLTTVALAGRSAIESGVRTLHAAMADDAVDADLEPVARLLLQPLEPHLQTARIAIVVDGVLEHVPFAALPLRNGSRILDRHETLRMPAAVWMSLPAAARRAGETPRVAVIADPVYTRDDARVAGTLSTSGLPVAAADATRNAPARLRFSRQEADAIAALTSATVLTDFRASKASLAALLVSDFDIVHIASHATQHTTRPDLSGLVLSLVDQTGRPIDGHVRLHEVIGLPLSGQVVVLSACQTVVGAELRGEGLQGLARGFLQAGARTVVASLWDVDDRATMTLMRHFYEALVRDGMPASRALERAQRAMHADARWRAPRYWAGFVALGAPE